MIVVAGLVTAAVAAAWVFTGIVGFLRFWYGVQIVPQEKLCSSGVPASK